MKRLTDNQTTLAGGLLCLDILLAALLAP